eukprot:6198549-Pleurochrysis_carterae.AAC.3
MSASPKQCETAHRRRGRACAAHCLRAGAHGGDRGQGVAHEEDALGAGERVGEEDDPSPTSRSSWAVICNSASPGTSAVGARHQSP